MKVAYITQYNSDDVNQASGLGYFIAKSLEKHGVKICRINCQVKHSLLQKLKSGLVKVLERKQFLIERDRSYLQQMAAKAKKRLTKFDYDIIFSPSSLPVSYLKCNKPIVFFSDATFDCMVDFYPGWGNLSRKTIDQGNAAESRAIKNAALIFYSSEWARENAISRYSGDPNKIRQVSYGSNIASIRSLDDTKKLIHRRMQNEEKKLLFVGVDWDRKGAAKAIQTVARLNESGVKSTLALVGPKVSGDYQQPSFVRNYSFISKADENGKNVLNELFENADFFILPTMADCTPVVFAEAASYGLPVITTNVGGCSSSVINGETGFCFDTESFIQKAVDKIRHLSNAKDEYEQLCVNSFRHFNNNLNWDVSGKKIVDALKILLTKQPGK